MKKITLIAAFFVLLVLNIALYSTSAPASSNLVKAQAAPGEVDKVIVIQLNQSTVREDFFASITGKDVNVCSCSDAVNAITLKNTGNAPSFYTLSVSGEAAQQVTLAPSVLRLEPNEQRLVFVHINTPCKKYISQRYEITIQTNLGLTKKLSQQLNYLACTNLELRTTANAYLNCPCSPTKYFVDVINTGDFPEVYSIATDLPKEFYTLSSSELFIFAGKKDTVYAYVTLPCDFYGTKEFALNVKARTSGFNAVLPLYLESSQSCYKFDVQLGNVFPLINETLKYQFMPSTTNNYQVCEQSAYAIPVKIKNPSNILNEHNLELYGPEWASLNYNSISLWPKQEADTAIVLAPEQGSEGTYTLVLNTTTARGQISQLTTLNVEVVNCFPSQEEELPILKWVLISVLFILAALVLALLIILASKRRAKEFEGKEDKKMPLWLKILLVLVAILIILALLLIPLYIYYSIVVAPASTATNATNATIAKNITITSNASVQKITNITTNITKQPIFATLSKAKKYLLSLLLGLLGLVILAIIVLLIINFTKRKTILFKKKEKVKKIELKPKKEFKFKEPSKEKKEKKEKIKVDKVLDVIYEKKQSKLWKKILFLVIFILLIIGAGLAIIYFNVNLPLIPNLANISITKATNITVAVQKTSTAVAPTTKPILTELPKTENFTYRMWPKNTKKIINLSKNVKDPDNDVLTFSFTPVQNISIEIKNGIATLTPTKDFTGIRHVTFRASDSKGGEVTLPIMTLVVTDSDEEKPFYVGWIVAGTLVVIILIAATVLVYRSNKKKQ